MPSRSHGRCKVCRAITHINSRFGLCAVHMRQRNKRIEQERKDAKERKRLRALASITVLEEGPAMTEFKQIEQAPTPDKTARPPRDRLSGMSDDRKLIIAGHYANYEIPVEEIVHHYAIANGDVTRIADELGVPRRDRRNVGRRLPPGRFIQDQWIVEPDKTVPPAVEQALENMLKLPPRPEPVAPTPAVERRVQQDTEPMQTWRIQISGFLTIQATSIEEALFEAKRRGGPLVKITYMQLVDS